MWQQLRERRLIQWVLAYLAGAWALVQVLAWYHGEKGAQRASAAELIMLAAILVIAGAAITLVRRTAAPEPAQAAGAPAAGELPPLPVSRESSIAVLPFTNLSDDRENEHFSDGLTEELLTDLARSTNLRVISRTSVMRYKDQELSVREIGDQLGVAHLVAGSVRRSGTRVRITAQLIDARVDRHIWAESYDSEWSDIFAIQREISSKIAGALRAAIPGQQHASPTSNPAAYQLYLEGRHLFNQRFDQLASEPLRRAENLLRQAVELDPTFTRAWAVLGLVYAHLATRPQTILPQPEALARAQSAIAQAVSLDSMAADAYVARGIIHLRQLNWAEAEQSFQRALRAEPQNADAYSWYGILLVAVGRSQEAERVCRRAAELDPINASTLHWLADALRNSGRIDESRLYAQRSMDLGMIMSGVGLYIYHVRRGEWTQALEEQERMLRPQGIDPAFATALVDAIRDPRGIPAAVALAEAVTDTTPILETYTPSLFFDLADPGPAFTAVERLVARNLGVYSLWRMWEPDFGHMRNHPRFRRLARDTGLLDYWRTHGWPDLCRPQGDAFACR